MALKLNRLLLDRPKGMQRPRLLKGGGSDVVPSQVRRTTEKKTPEAKKRTDKGKRCLVFFFIASLITIGKSTQDPYGNFILGINMTTV